MNNPCEYIVAYAKEIKQEPVACMKIEYFRGSKSMTNIHLEHYDPDLPEGKYELYTHPVKQLSEERFIELLLGIEKLNLSGARQLYRAIIKEITE